MKTLSEALFSKRNILNTDTSLTIRNLEIEFFKNEDIFKFSVHNKGNKNNSISCYISLDKIIYIIDKIKNNDPENNVVIWGKRGERAWLEIISLKDDKISLDVSDCKCINRFLINSKDDKEQLILFLEKHNI